LKFSHLTLRFIICILCISILFTGCYSYYTIPSEDYSKIENMEDIKIVYTNGKEFVVEKNDTTYAKVIGDSLIVKRGLENKFIQMNEVEKIRENRFNLVATITLTVVGLAILFVVFASNISPGG
jgi:hypothetical protein